MTIQLFKPFMGEEEVQAVAEVLRSGWIGLGPKTAEFEQAFAAFLGVPHAVALNSATAALDLKGTASATLQDGAGAKVALAGPSVNINNGALEVV